MKWIILVLMCVGACAVDGVPDGKGSCTDESCAQHEEQAAVQVPQELQLDGGAKTETACIGNPGDCYHKGGFSDAERNKYCARECDVAFASCSVAQNVPIVWGCEWRDPLPDMDGCWGIGQHTNANPCPSGTRKCSIVYDTVGTCKVLSAPQ